MFTGIIEATGVIKAIESEGTNKHFFCVSSISHELKVDQSLSHNGVCLTVTKLENGGHWVTAVDETLKKSNLGFIKVDDKMNLERAMPANGRFDGHIVQGHVDQTAKVKSVKDIQGSWLYTFEINSRESGLVVEKGSVCINGVSLTCFDVTNDSFSVAIIPYTFEHTNFHQLQPGDTVNIEFDIVGKYVQKLLSK
jgi:riboflavin synthase